MTKCHKTIKWTKLIYALSSAVKFKTMENFENMPRTFIKLTSKNEFTCTGNGPHCFKIDLAGPIEKFSEILHRLSNLNNYTTHNIYSNKEEKKHRGKDEKYDM